MCAADRYFQRGWSQRDLVRVHNAEYGVKRVANRLVTAMRFVRVKKKMNK